MVHDNSGTYEALINAAEDGLVCRGVYVHYHTTGLPSHCKILAYAIERVPTPIEASRMHRVLYIGPLDFSRGWHGTQIKFSSYPMTRSFDCREFGRQVKMWQTDMPAVWREPVTVAFARQRSAGNTETMPLSHPDITRHLTLMEQQVRDAITSDNKTQPWLERYTLPWLMGLNHSRHNELLRVARHFQGW